MYEVVRSKITTSKNFIYGDTYYLCVNLPPIEPVEGFIYIDSNILDETSVRDQKEILRIQLDSGTVNLERYNSLLQTVSKYNLRVELDSQDTRIPIRLGKLHYVNVSFFSKEVGSHYCYSFNGRNYAVNPNFLKIEKTNTVTASHCLSVNGVLVYSLDRIKYPYIYYYSIGAFLPNLGDIQFDKLPVYSEGIKFIEGIEKEVVIDEHISGYAYIDGKLEKSFPLLKNGFKYILSHYSNIKKILLRRSYTDGVCTNLRGNIKVLRLSPEGDVSSVIDLNMDELGGNVRENIFPFFYDGAIYILEEGYEDKIVRNVKIRSDCNYAEIFLGSKTEQVKLSTGIIINNNGVIHRDKFPFFFNGFSYELVDILGENIALVTNNSPSVYLDLEDSDRVIVYDSNGTRREISNKNGMIEIQNFPFYYKRKYYFIKRSNITIDSEIFPGNLQFLTRPINLDGEECEATESNLPFIYSNVSYNGKNYEKLLFYKLKIESNSMVYNLPSSSHVYMQAKNGFLKKVSSKMQNVFGVSDISELFEVTLAHGAKVYATTSRSIYDSLGSLSVGRLLLDGSLVHEGKNHYYSSAEPEWFSKDSLTIWSVELINGRIVNRVNIIITVTSLNLFATDADFFYGKNLYTRGKPVYQNEATETIYLDNNSYIREYSRVGLNAVEFDFSPPSDAALLPKKFNFHTSTWEIANINSHSSTSNEFGVFPHNFPFYANGNIFNLENFTSPTIYNYVEVELGRPKTKYSTANQMCIDRYDGDIKFFEYREDMKSVYIPDFVGIDVYFFDLVDNKGFFRKEKVIVKDGLVSIDIFPFEYRSSLYALKLVGVFSKKIRILSNKIVLYNVSGSINDVIDYLVSRGLVYNSANDFINASDMSLTTSNGLSLFSRDIRIEGELVIFNENDKQHIKNFPLIRDGVLYELIFVKSSSSLVFDDRETAITNFLPINFDREVQLQKEILTPYGYFSVQEKTTSVASTFIRSSVKNTVVNKVNLSITKKYPKTKNPYYNKFEKGFYILEREINYERIYGVGSILTTNIQSEFDAFKSLAIESLIFDSFYVYEKNFVSHLIIFSPGARTLETFDEEEFVVYVPDGRFIIPSDYLFDNALGTIEIAENQLRGFVNISSFKFHLINVRVDNEIKTYNYHISDFDDFFSLYISEQEYCYKNLRGGVTKITKTSKSRSVVLNNYSIYSTEVIIYKIAEKYYGIDENFPGEGDLVAKNQRPVAFERTDSFYPFVFGSALFHLVISTVKVVKIYSTTKLVSDISGFYVDRNLEKIAAVSGNAEVSKFPVYDFVNHIFYQLETQNYESFTYYSDVNYLPEYLSGDYVEESEILSPNYPTQSNYKFKSVEYTRINLPTKLIEISNEEAEKFVDGREVFSFASGIYQKGPLERSGLRVSRFSF